MNPFLQSVKRLWLVWLGPFLALVFGIALYGWYKLPSGVLLATSYNDLGRPDQWASKPMIILSALAVTLLVSLIWLGFVIMPTAIKRMPNEYKAVLALMVAQIGHLIIASLAMLSGVYISVILIAAGANFNALLAQHLVTGILIIVFGFILLSLKPDYIYSIGGPWALPSRKAWSRVFNIGGIWMVSLGAIALLSYWLNYGKLWYPFFAIQILLYELAIIVFTFLPWLRDKDMVIREDTNNGLPSRYPSIMTASGKRLSVIYLYSAQLIIVACFLLIKYV